MRNFNIFGVHWKIRILGAGEGGCYQKTDIEGGIAQFPDLKEGLARKRGWCVWGGGGGFDTPMHTMSKNAFWK